MCFTEKPPPVLIIPMRQVPIIDATGSKTLRDIHKGAVHHGAKFILSEIVSTQVKEELRTSRLLFAASL